MARTGIGQRVGLTTLDLDMQTMGTPVHRNGHAPPPSDDGPGLAAVTTAFRPSLVDALVRRATERDVAAEERARRARAVVAALEADPRAHTALEVAHQAVAAEAEAAADRDAAAADRATLVRLVTGGRTPDDVCPPPGLTRREAQVLERLARAMTTRAIADDLYLSPNSVKTHTQSVYRKIGVRSRSEAALWARDHGIG